MDFDTSQSCYRICALFWPPTLPVPGGGGASALVGAMGTALGNMVGSLTVGKKEVRRCGGGNARPEGQVRRPPDRAF